MKTLKISLFLYYTHSIEILELIFNPTALVFVIGGPVDPFFLYFIRVLGVTKLYYILNVAQSDFDFTNK